MSSMSADVRCISDPFSERNDVIDRTRASLLGIAADINLLQHAVDYFPSARFPTMHHVRESAAVEELLHMFASECDSTAYPEQRDMGPENANTLRETLLDFATHMQLPFTASPSDLHALVLDVDALWHNTSGCFGHFPTKEQADQAEGHGLRNLEALKTFSRILRHTQPVTLRHVLPRYRATSLTYWYREAKHLIQHALLSWMPDIQENSATDELLRLTRWLPEQHGWAIPDARDLILAMNDAIAAILTFGIVDPRLTTALYEPVERAIPFDHVHRPATISD